MLCRGVLSRLANEATKQSTIDVTQVTRQIRRVHLSSNVANLARASRIVLIPLSRSYATTTSLPHRGRPKKGSPGEKAAKTRSRATRAKAPATKKAAPKRKSASGRKAAPKRKAAAPKKKAAPKRKVLTEAQQKRAADKKKTLETRELKETALLGKEPKKKPYTAWTVFASENIPKGTASGNLGGLMKENAAKYRDLSAAEMEHYNHLANQNKASNELDYKAWVESHSAEDIRQANHARVRLKQLTKPKKGSRSFSPIHDQRQVKRPASAYNQYMQDRYASGDFKAIGLGESTKLIIDEFKALSPSEKKKYVDLSEQATQRYKREFKQAYGHDAPMFNHTAAAQATATA